MIKLQNCKVSVWCPYYTINSFLLIMSIITLTVSLALCYEFSIFDNYLEYYLDKSIILLIIGSIVVFADACLGLISLKRRSVRGIITFVIMTMYLFVAMVGFIILTYTFSINAEKMIYSRLKQDMENSSVDNDIINRIENYLNCCGYENSPDSKNRSTKIAQSCCSYNAICDTENALEISTNSCRGVLENFLTFRKFFVAGVLVVLGIIEICSIILSLFAYQDLIRKPVMPVHVGNGTCNTTDTSLSRNPLGNLPTVDTLPTIDNLPSGSNSDSYVRRPTQLPIILNYRSPHEGFLKRAPQLRFDRRVTLSNAKLKNPYATRWTYDA